MASPSRLPPPALIARLLRQPEAFDFIQAVRLLERQHRLQPALADGHANEGVRPEAVQFVSNIALRYPTAAIVSAQLALQETRVQLTSGLFGLVGAMGVLPHSYTDLAIQSLHARNPGYTAFLDIFHHRATRLFWEASTKYRIAIAHEMACGEEEDDFTLVLRSLAGIGTPATYNRLSVPDSVMLHNASLFASGIHTLTGLEQLLSHLLDRPVTVEPFIGGWQALGEEEQTRLVPPDDPAAAHARLGISAMIGAQVWMTQNAFRIIVGPVDGETLHDLLPDGETFRQVQDLVRLYCGLEFDFDINVIVEARSVPAARLVLGTGSPDDGRLGLTTWLLSAPSVVDRDDTRIAANDMD